ncbi:hypothetical protein CIK99_09485 [Prevotella sp. P5-92]|uniref:fimbrillin family protein n=1 Tax=Prevotella sp. P5-92 TaxID=2024222 RepID=UPI000B96FEBC|nr:fimbrillin family protein [Prevotella sp. P5-92]OYP56491.1 hypothetical protein CIK99_09485 [Prevotella sp. P5-92]
MKRNNIYAWMAAAMTLAACSTNDIADLGGNDADNVVNVAATRANTSSNDNTIKAFHLVNTTQQSEYDKKYEADYKYDDASSTYVMTNGTVLWCNTNDNAGTKVNNLFQAFTPLTTAANLASYDRFYIPIYQASPELLAAADWMTATATSTKAAATDGLSLNFEHCNAKLHFTVTTKGDDVTTLSSEDITVIGGITPYYHTDESNKTIEAIVAPVSADEITSSTSRPTLISFRLAGGDEISVPLPTSITEIAAGKQYNFSITVGHNALTISSVSVTDWNNQDITEDENDEAASSLPLPPYVTFTSNEEVGFKMTTNYGYTISDLEYSVNYGEWKLIPENGISDGVTFGSSKGNLRLRGKNLNGTATNERSCSKISFSSNETNAKVACTGDIRSLLDYENYNTVNTSNARFCQLFSTCDILTSAPELPATELAESCYYSMFFECQSLTTAPELPAMTLAKGCYYNMFNNCKALTSAPELPATKLANNCYNGMFYDCTNLESVTMLATDVSARDCLYKWLYDAGTDDSVTQRTLTVASQEAYNTIVNTKYDNNPALPDNWKKDASGTTVIYNEQ